MQLLIRTIQNKKKKRITSLMMPIKSKFNKIKIRIK